MTSEKAINMLHGIRADNLNLDDAYTKDKYEALDMAIKALEQEPCEDAISRQEVLSCSEAMRDMGDLGKVKYVVLVDNIKMLPSVQPKAKVGKWIRVDKTKVKCSECDITHFIAQYPMGEINYCPNCGAKMESEVDK